MHHPTNHLRGQGGHRSHLARSFRGHSGSCSPASELRRTTFPMVPCGCHRAIKVLFQNSLHSETPPSRVPFSPTTPSRLSRLSGSNRRASARRRAVPRGTSGGGSLPGWVDGAGRERARGRGGGSVSAGRSGDQLAGGRAPNGAPALAAAPPPLRVAGRPGGRDNVAGLVAGRQPPSCLKWVPPGCCLSGRRGDPGGGGGSAHGVTLPSAAGGPCDSAPAPLLRPRRPNLPRGRPQPTGPSSWSPGLASPSPTLAPHRVAGKGPD